MPKDLSLHNLSFRIYTNTSLACQYPIKFIENGIIKTILYPNGRNNDGKYILLTPTIPVEKFWSGVSRNRAAKVSYTLL